MVTTYLFGQRSNTVFSFGGNDFQNWTYQDFIKNKVKKVVAYSYQIKKNGKFSNDSILIYRQELDRDSNKVFGENCNSVWQSHRLSYLTWYSFQTNYNDKGQVVKHITSPTAVGQEKDYGSAPYDIYRDITTYKYDNSGNEIYEQYQRIDDHFSIFTQDTFHRCSIEAKIYETNYNERGLKISRYYTVDSTRYLPTRSYRMDSNSIWCNYCHPKRLNDDYTYNENGKVKTWIWYTQEGKVHSKKYYYYDSIGRLIKQVDSTGWYFTTILPYLEFTTTYEYSDSGKIVTKVDHEISSPNLTVVKFNKKDQIISECSVGNSSNECTNYFYTYKKEKLISVTYTNSNKEKLETYFEYNPQGLLYEMKVIFENKVTQLSRYYYYE